MLQLPDKRVCDHQPPEEPPNEVATITALLRNPHVVAAFADWFETEVGMYKQQALHSTAFVLLHR